MKALKTVAIIFLLLGAVAVVIPDARGFLDEMFIDDEMNSRISFWGKVVDQEGRPLSEVEVEARMRRWPRLNLGMATQPKYITEKLRTDSQGHFELLNGWGDTFYVTALRKPGFFTPEKELRGFNYDRPQGYSADPNRRETFTLLEEDLAPAERMRSFRRGVDIPYDGTPVTLDLLSHVSGRGNHPGDLKITLERETLSLPPRALGEQIKYDWKATITVIEGGLVIKNSDLRFKEEENLELMYKAPDRGYESSYQVPVLADDPHWSARKAISFYFRSRGGNLYGRAALEISTNPRGAMTRLNIVGHLNPGGSPNLQKQEHRIANDRSY